MLRKKNILKRNFAIDCTSFIKGKSGGFESFLINLLDGIHQSSDMQLTLFIRNDQYKYFREFFNFNIICVNITNLFSRITWQNFCLPFHSFRYYAIIFPADFRPFFLFCKSITIFNDFQHLYLPQYWSFYKTLYRFIFCRISLKFSTKIITISHSVKKEISDNFKISDVEVIYIPINNKYFLNLQINQRLITRELACERFYLIPSSLEPHKNIINLQRAINNLGPLLNGIKFVFTGPYLKDDFLTEFLNESIHVLGYVEKSELYLLYQQCSGVILPSIYEGFGMPYVESIFFRKNILVCRIPITIELFGDLPFYIESPFSSFEIKKALIEFINNNTYIEHESHNRLKVESDQFYVTKKYLNIIDKI